MLKKPNFGLLGHKLKLGGGVRSERGVRTLPAVSSISNWIRFAYWLGE
jgi:hypothetical protein